MYLSEATKYMTIVSEWRLDSMYREGGFFPF